MPLSASEGHGGDAVRSSSVAFRLRVPSSHLVFKEGSDVVPRGCCLRGGGGGGGQGEPRQLREPGAAGAAPSESPSWAEREGARCAFCLRAERSAARGETHPNYCA